MSISTFHLFQEQQKNCLTKNMKADKLSDTYLLYLNIKYKI